MYWQLHSPAAHVSIATGCLLHMLYTTHVLADGHQKGDCTLRICTQKIHCTCRDSVVVEVGDLTNKVELVYYPCTSDCVLTVYSVRCGCPRTFRVEGSVGKAVVLRRQASSNAVQT